MRFIPLMLACLLSGSAIAATPAAYDGGAAATRQLGCAGGDGRVLLRIGLGQLGCNGFVLPVELHFAPAERIPGIYGPLWRSPVIESHCLPLSERILRVFTPWGETLMLFRSEQDRMWKAPTDRRRWQARAPDDDTVVVASPVDGIELTFAKGRIARLSGRGPDVAWRRGPDRIRILQGGRELLDAAMDGSTIGFAGRTLRLSSPACKALRAPALARVGEGQLADHEFAYEALADGLVRFAWSRRAGASGWFTFTPAGIPVEDQASTYQVTTSDTAVAIHRSFRDGGKESYEQDRKVGLERITHLGGTSLVTLFDVQRGYRVRRKEQRNGAGEIEKATSFDYDPVDGRLAAMVEVDRLSGTTSRWDLGATPPSLTVTGADGASERYAVSSDGRIAVSR